MEGTQQQNHHAVKDENFFNPQYAFQKQLQKITPPKNHYCKDSPGKPTDSETSLADFTDEVQEISPNHSQKPPIKGELPRTN